MKPPLLQLSLAGLETKTLRFSAPELAGLRAARSEIRETFLAQTRNGGGGSAPYSGYAAALRAGLGAEASKKAAAGFHLMGIKTLVVLGIGGSSLGAKCLYEALKLVRPLRELVFLENLDPLVLQHHLQSFDWKSTGFAAITKSGGTIETVAQLSQILPEAQKQLGSQWKQHFIAITDPQKGELRAWAKAEGLLSLEIPSDVGGRFSVFTPVGLFPLAFAGLDIDALLGGARDFMAGKVTPFEDIETLGMRLLDFAEQGSDTQVLMPYATSLKALGEWCVQLIGESLGKERAPQKRVGLVPLPALGATDQHSLLQLLMEGPQRFVTHFVEVQNWPETAKLNFLTLPTSFQTFALAQGQPLADLLNMELAATAGAMERSGRAFFKISLAEFAEAPLGALLAFYMDLVSYLGAALEINPYDQPGVELGKLIFKDLVSKK